MDDIDWAKVKSMEKVLAKKKSQAADEEKAEEVFDEVGTLKKLVSLLQPKETVTTAMKKFGKKAGGAEKWKNKKAKVEGEDDEESKLKLDGLISCADELLSNGNLSIYQYTFEDVQQKIKDLSEKKETTAVDSLDMFGEAESTNNQKPAESKLVFIYDNELFIKNYLFI